MAPVSKAEIRREARRCRDALRNVERALAMSAESERARKLLLDASTRAAESAGGIALLVDARLEGRSIADIER